VKHKKPQVYRETMCPFCDSFNPEGAMLTVKQHIAAVHKKSGKQAKL
jgi:hypothetical protein